MAIDVLQNKIKKCGSSLMVDLSVTVEDVPPALLNQVGTESAACLQYSKTLLERLKGIVPAVRFRFLLYSLQGRDGLSNLSELMKLAHSLGFYTLLEISGVSSSDDAVRCAKIVWQENSFFPCDAVQISGFYGSDVLKPFLIAVENQKKDLFVTARSVGKSSAEIQDLLSGSRTVHLAIADNVNRYGAPTIGKYGFSRVCISASASSGDSLKMLRTKYPHLFLLIDGIDYPGANAKNCSCGFNNLGYGAVVCVGSSVTQAWKEKTVADYLSAAVESAKKTQNKLDRYISIL